MWEFIAVGGENMGNMRGGFTLMELLVVVIIIGILAAAAVPQYFKIVERARVSEAQSTFSSVKSAQMRVMAKDGKYTDKWDGLDLIFSDAEGRPCAGTGACAQKVYTYLLDSDGSIYATRNPSPTPAANYGTYTLIHDIGSGGTTCTNANCLQELLQ